MASYRQSEEFSKKVKEGMACAKAQGRFPGNFVDLTNRKFGSLVVRSQAPNGKCGRVRWHCECKCGNFTDVFADALASGKTKSCGCGMGLRLGIRRPPHRYIWFNYRGSAKRRKLAFTLTLEHLALIISQSCVYCGKPPSQAMSASQMRPSYEAFRYSGIDRIDSARGYVEGNVVPCCKSCNEMKSDKSHEDFLRQVEAIHDWQKGKTLSASAG